MVQLNLTERIDEHQQRAKALKWLKRELSTLFRDISRISTGERARLSERDWTRRYHQASQKAKELGVEIPDEPLDRLLVT